MRVSRVASRSRDATRRRRALDSLAGAEKRPPSLRRQGAPAVNVGLRRPPARNTPQARALTSAHKSGIARRGVFLCPRVSVKARFLSVAASLALSALPGLARADDAPPARKAGLWEIVTSMKAAPKMQACVDAASEAKTNALGMATAQEDVQPTRRPSRRRRLHPRFRLQAWRLHAHQPCRDDDARRRRLFHGRRNALRSALHGQDGDDDDHFRQMAWPLRRGHGNPAISSSTAARFTSAADAARSGAGMRSGQPVAE